MTNGRTDRSPANLKFVELQNLLLDPDNPRLPKYVDRAQPDMLTYIARNTSIEELMEVIGQNGFFTGEPLIVIPDGEQYVVVEGNRRLSAVKLLNDPSLAPADRRRKIRDVSQEAQYRPAELPVVVRASRQEVLTYLGYRHITGVKQWEPLAKARYMLQLFQHTDPDLSVSNRVKTVAREIGSRSNHIKRYLNALSVYDEIEESDHVSLENIAESQISFSLLSTALGYNNILNFVGADGETEADAFIDDRSQINQDHLSELATWLFVKGEENKPWVPESRDIKKLASVVANQSALKAAREGATLDRAYQRTVGISEDLMNHLYQAQESLDEALKICSHVTPTDDAIKLAQTNHKTARNIYRLLSDPDDN